MIRDYLFPFIAFVMIYLGMLVMQAPPLMALVMCLIIAFLSKIGDLIFIGGRRNAIKKKYGFLADESKFQNSILILTAAVIRADGKASKPELNFVESALELHFSEKKVDKQMAFLRTLIQRETLNYKSVCKQVNDNYRSGEKIQMLHFIIGIVASDGLLSTSEYETVKDIGLRMRLPLNTINVLFKMFNFITEQDIKEQQKRRERKENRTHSFKLSKAYDILGIDDRVTDKQVKKAYRNLAKQHHPDALINLDKVHKDLAKERFQIILDAYETIKSKRGFN